MGAGFTLSVSEEGGEPDLSIKPEEYIEVISTEDQRIKVIGEELANDTGRAIFARISQGTTSSNDLAKGLGISLPLVNWLMGVGLIKVERIEMSQKNKKMKFYGPVKTALVIIPPGQEGGKGNPDSKKETVLMRLRHFMASIISFVAGASGIYVAEKAQVQNAQYSVPAQPGPEMHAAMRTAPLAAPAPPAGTSSMGVEPTMILLALAGGAVLFFAAFFLSKFAQRRKRLKATSLTEESP